MHLHWQYFDSRTALLDGIASYKWYVALFAGADMTNAVLDRVDFTRANLKNAKFHNAVVTGIVVKDADLSGASFDDALIGGEDVKRLWAFS